MIEPTFGAVCALTSRAGTSERTVVSTAPPAGRLREAHRRVTADRGIRALSDVKGIDEAVRAYHQFTPQQHRQRANALDTIITRCTDYLHDSQNARRKVGVQTLHTQASAEVTVYRALADSENLPNPGEKFRLLAPQLDSIRRLEKTDPETAYDLSTLDIHNKLQQLAAELSTSSPAEFRRLAHEHVDILRGLLTERDLPAETREILTEVLSNANLISFEGGGPQGTTLTNRSGPNAAPQNTLSAPPWGTPAVPRNGPGTSHTR